MQHESGLEQKACNVSPCLFSLPAPLDVLRDLMVIGTSPAQSPLQMQTCCRCRAHTCTELLGYSRLKQKQTFREKNKIACCQEGDGEGWRSEGESRTGKQLAAFFYATFFFFPKWFYASSSNVRGAAEVLKGKKEA